MTNSWNSFYFSLLLFLVQLYSQWKFCGSLPATYFLTARDNLYYCFTVKIKNEPMEQENGEEEKFVFHHRKREKVIDHLGGTRGYSKTIYVVKHNIAKVIPNIETFHRLGLTEQNDLSHEVSEDEFKNNYIYNYESLPTMQYTGLDKFDEVMDREIFRSTVLQGITLHNYTFLGDYINPSILRLSNRLLMATGLAWFGHDNHDPNEHIEFRWLNHSLAPFFHFSKLRNPYPTTNDPNPNDTYYLGVSEQHIANLGGRVLIGQDPRMIAISEKEFYVVFTNRFNTPTTMGAAFVHFNHTLHEWQILTSHMVIYHISDGNPQKNWSPFLLLKEGSPHPLHHQTRDSPHSSHSHHLSADSLEYYKDLYLIQQIHPLTVYRVNYEDLRNPQLDEKDLPHALVSQDNRDLVVDWTYGHLRGGTNAVYLSRYGCYLSFFHSSTILPGSSIKTYVFGAYTFTTTIPFQLLAYTYYPIMSRELYSGPWNPLKNRHIDYVAFPMSCLLIRDETEVLLSLGHQDVKGLTTTIIVAELMNNLVPVLVRNHTSTRSR